MSRNEVRDDLGLDDVSGGDEPMVDTMNGPVPLPGSALDQQMKQEQQDQLEQTQQHTLAITEAKAKQPVLANQPNQPSPKPGKQQPQAEKVVPLAVKKSLDTTNQCPTKHCGYAKCDPKSTGPRSYCIEESG